MAKILITGGSGLLGKVISELLIQDKHQVVWLSREEGDWNGIKKYKWDINKKYINEKALEGIHAIVHLAGSGIADKRWTDSYKQEIIDSRVKSSELLFETIQKQQISLSTFVGGSAIGYYGANQSKQIIIEESAPGNDFLAKSCVLWENSYLPFVNSQTRTVIIRTGVVLSKNGGAYPKMALPFKFGFGAAIASGKQNFPWIHIKDIAGIFVFALFNKQVKGIYNAVGSEFISNKDFSKQLAHSLHKPFFLPNVPAAVLKLAMGEGAAMVTEGLKISNQKIKQAGYAFAYEHVKSALQDLLD